MIPNVPVIVKSTIYSVKPQKPKIVERAKMMISLKLVFAFVAVVESCGLQNNLWLGCMCSKRSTREPAQFLIVGQLSKVGLKLAKPPQTFPRFPRLTLCHFQQPLIALKALKKKVSFFLFWQCFGAGAANRGWRTISLKKSR